MRLGLWQEVWAVHFSEMLTVNGGLLELHLGTMGLSDTGMERLCDGLQHNRSLRYLDLRWWVQDPPLLLRAALPATDL